MGGIQETVDDRQWAICHMQLTLGGRQWKGQWKVGGRQWAIGNGHWVVGND